jgi:hypothetical protein
MMLAIGLSYIAFTFLLSWFSYEVVLDLIKAFSAPIEMIKWFLSLFLLMCCITFIDLLPWGGADLVMVNDLSDVLLDSVCYYYVEGFCTDVH